MNTTAAAIEARVTVATIRTWCRRGAVAAIKQAGRWIIDATSLARRITIGATRRRKPMSKEIEYTVENLTRIGGSRWQKNGMDRIYFNNWATLAGLETTRYNSGNIASAAYQGEGISNSQAAKIVGCIAKAYWDATEKKWHVVWGFDNPKIGRDQVWNDFLAGARKAIEAL